MRLICPNCGAQYEVADDVIPASGRDVQCSNCGHTWMQMRDGAKRDADLAIATAPPSQDAPGRAAEEEAPPPRRELDPEVTDILREEAARETAARRAETEAIESQSDLGLDLPPERVDAPEPAEAPEPVAAAEEAELAPAPQPEPPQETAAEPEDVEEAPTEDSNSRRDLLPDIEEINSTLKSESGIDDGIIEVAPEAAEAERRRGFRRGFLTIMILVALGAVVYLYAPQIEAAVPQAATVLGPYVETVDQARGWLDVRLQSFLSWANETAGAS